MFEKPETFDGLDLDALRALSVEALEEARGIMAADDSDLTDDQIARVEELMSASADIDAEVATRETVEAERVEKIAALRAQTAAEDPEPEPEAEPVEEAEEPDAEAEAETQKEVVVASTPAPKRTVAIAQKRAPEVVATPAKPHVALLASGKNMATKAVNEEFSDLTELALEFAATAKRGPSGDMAKFKVPEAGQWGLSANHSRNTFAKFQREDRVHQIGHRMSADEQMRVIQDAGRMTGDTAALVAAGGWCAPSETLYDFCSYETFSGGLDIPTISVSRGGINFSKGPDYATIAAMAASHFDQTEAQAEAGTVKVCLAVECPPFEEVRMDVVGFCLTNGVLTDTAYPELTRRYLEILAVAHAHRVNQYVINHILAEVGAAVPWAGALGATTADFLEGVSFAAWRLRSQYAMGANATIEGFAPTWAKPIIQADLSRRTGVDMLNVSDAQINSYLSARNVRLQFVEDYAPLGGASNWPATVPVTLYPAGAFVKATTDVLDLDTIYDSVGLSTNTYTAAFMEEGILVANRCASGLQISVPVCTSGQTGAADITCVTP